MNDNPAGGDLPAPFSCPHCGVAGEVHWFKDAYIRYRALDSLGDAVPVDGSTALVIRYDDNKLVCESCGREIDLEDRDVEIVHPVFRLDPDALEHGFAADRKSTEAPLSLLPGGDLESFGEFTEAVIGHAQHRWSAIHCPEGVSVRLQPLFPRGEQLLPLLIWNDRPDLVLAGPPVTRDVLSSRLGRGLATASVESAVILCGFAVDAANEILRHPEAAVAFA